jgi:hypothetical protein
MTASPVRPFAAVPDMDAAARVHVGHDMDAVARVDESMEGERNRKESAE